VHSSDGSSFLPEMTSLPRAADAGERSWMRRSKLHPEKKNQKKIDNDQLIIIIIISFLQSMSKSIIQ